MKYASAQAYDGADLLRTWKESSKLLFRAVEHITSYRAFLIVGDDGSFNATPVEPPGTINDAFPDSGDFYAESDLMEQVSELQARSLPGALNLILTFNLL